jgi:hypothetical protein
MELTARDDPRPLIPEGVYDAVFTREEPGHIFGTYKLYLYFKIVTSGQYNETELFLPFNINKEKKMALASKYYKTWCLVNGGQRPSRNAVMSPNIFRGKFFEVAVKTIRKSYNGDELPPSLFYSIIDKILTVSIGIE